jgi:hypothetical protein
MVAIIIVLRGYSINKPHDISTPKAIVKSYFLALNSNDYEFIETITPYKRNEGNARESSVKTIKLIHVKEDKKSAENFIKYGMGMTNNYSDVVSFKVIYYLKNKKGEDIFQTNVINEKWITLTKDKEDSPWIIREMGEG